MFSGRNLRKTAHRKQPFGRRLSNVVIPSQQLGTLAAVLGYDVAGLNRLFPSLPKVGKRGSPVLRTSDCSIVQLTRDGLSQ